MNDWDRVARSDPYYKFCVGAVGALGGISGGIVGGVASPATGGASFVAVPYGIGLGLAVGYLTCPYLVPRVRNRIESGQPLSKSDMKSAAEAMGRYARVSSARDAVKLVAIVRAHAAQAQGKSPTMNGSYLALQCLGG